MRPQKLRSTIPPARQRYVPAPTVLNVLAVTDSIDDSTAGRKMMVGRRSVGLAVHKLSKKFTFLFGDL